MTKHTMGRDTLSGEETQSNIKNVFISFCLIEAYQYYMQEEVKARLLGTCTFFPPLFFQYKADFFQRFLMENTALQIMYFPELL